MKLVEEATYGQVQMIPLPSRDERSFTQKLKDAWNDVDYQPVVEHVAGRPPKIECVIEFGADAPMLPKYRDVFKFTHLNGIDGKSGPQVVAYHGVLPYEFLRSPNVWRCYVDHIEAVMEIAS